MNIRELDDYLRSKGVKNPESLTSEQYVHGVLDNLAGEDENRIHEEFRRHLLGISTIIGTIVPPREFKIPGETLKKLSRAFSRRGSCIFEPNVDEAFSSLIGRGGAGVNSAIKEITSSSYEYRNRFVNRSIARGLADHSKLIREHFSSSLEHLLSKDKDWMVREIAIPALADHPNLAERRIPVVLLRSKDESVRKATVDALSNPKLSKLAKRYLPDFLGPENTTVVRNAAIRALTNHPKLLKRHIPTLLGGGGTFATLVAAQALANPRLLKLAGKHLMALLEDRSLSVRSATIHALTNHPKLLKQHISVLLNSKDRFVVVAAIRALANPKLAKLAETHIPDLLSHNDKVVKAAATGVLANPKLAKLAETHLPTLSKDDEWQIREAAAEALANHPKLAEQHLPDLLTDENDWVRLKATEALANPKLAKLAETHIQELSRDPEWSVRVAAFRASLKHPKVRNTLNPSEIGLEDLYSVLSALPPRKRKIFSKKYGNHPVLKHICKV